MMFPLLEKGFLDLRVVFDHPVVNEGEFSALVEMGMRILIGWFAMGRPPGVADAIGAGRGIFAHQFGEPGDASRALASLDMVAIDDCHPGGIVTAVFQPAQTIEQNGRGFLFADVSDDATHGWNCRGGYCHLQ